MTFAEALEAIESARKSENPAVELYRLAETLPAAPLCLLAKSFEVSLHRYGEDNQAAVVALAEGVALIDRFDVSVLTRDWQPYHNVSIISKMAHGLSAALDLPEIDFESVEEILGKLEALAATLDVYPGRLWEVRIRVAFLRDEIDVAERWIARVLPHLNQSKRISAGQSCPSCLLSWFTWWRGGGDVEEIERLFAPVYDGDTDYPNEEHDVIDHLPRKLLYCEFGHRNCLSVHAMVLTRAGALERARTQIDAALALKGSDLCIVSEIVALEHALATGDESLIEARIGLLQPRVASHDDIEEKFLAELQLTSAYALYRDAAATNEMIKAATDSAARLDARGRTDKWQRHLRAHLQSQHIQ